MTRKHFVMLATTFARLKPETIKPLNRVGDTVLGQIIMWEKSIYALADFCATQNAQFDRAKFLAACEVE